MSPNALYRALEPLEQRRLLSVTVAESEQNDGPGAADGLPRLAETPIHVTGSIGTPGDLDWFKIKLKAGDVVGAIVTGQPGLDPMLHLGNSDIELMIHNDDSFNHKARFMPPESPLPRVTGSIRDPEIHYVISESGTYYIQVSAFTDPDTGETSTGTYDMELLVARPGMEHQPIGAKQKLFIDFDGAVLDAFEWFPPEASGQHNIAPLAASLKEWGLKQTDLNAVINQTMARLTDKIYTFVAANGDNGDYATSGTPGEFGVEILNSRDHADRWGTDPLVSRITVGRTENAWLANESIGAAHWLDIGNFVQDDEAVLTTNFVAGLLKSFPLARPTAKATLINFVAEYLAVIIAHEFGHLAGAVHTQFSLENAFNGEPVNLMDKDIRVPLGPDLVFGTADDITMYFGVDEYEPEDAAIGRNDTLNTVAFGCSTGTVRTRTGSAFAAVESVSLFSAWSADNEDDDDDLLTVSGPFSLA